MKKSASFDRAFRTLLGLEGGYSDDPEDSGGKTNLGVTIGVARKCGYKGRMQDIPRDVVKAIYRKEYWDACRCGDMDDYVIAAEVFDTAVNCGRVYAARFLQRALNLFNNRGKRYPDVKVDGKIGKNTIRILNRALKAAPPYYPSIIWKALNCFQGTRYAAICKKKPKNEKYAPGWYRARVGL